MPYIFRFCKVLFIVFLLWQCKTPEVPTERHYKPVFNQMQQSRPSVPKFSPEDVDTLALIRSNLIDEFLYVNDTIVIEDNFYLQYAELAIPIELLNAKPPVYDTFLVAREYLFTRDFVDVLFPLKPQKYYENLIIDEDTMNVSDSLYSPLNNTADTILIVEKELYSKVEIFEDTLRDLYDAENVIDALLLDVPWKTGDSIPYIGGMENIFRDSTLVLLFDTVYVRYIDPKDIVPPMEFDVMCNTFVDTVSMTKQFIYNDEITFKRFYPEEINVFVEMVKVVGGTFKIGSNDYDEDERPAYNIRVSNYLLSKHEITNHMFAVFLNDMNCDSIGEVNGHKFINLNHPLTKIRRDSISGDFWVLNGYDDYPVVNVTWVGAQRFCNTAGGRLPSEAEWEYAARGGRYAPKRYLGYEQNDYEYLHRYSGADYMQYIGWFVDNSRGKAWPVGRKLPNELGIYDMSGNVWEWCFDNYSSTFYRSNNRSNNPVNSSGSNDRVVRGGSWSNNAVFCRVSNRNRFNQNSANEYLGFRLMLPWK